MAGVTHNANIVINITLDASPAQEQGFGTVLGIFALASNSLNGATTMTFASVTEAQTAQTAGYISAAALAAVTAMFSQNPKPAQVKIGNIDLVGLETYAAAIARISLVDDDWYAAFIEVRDNTSILAISAAIEATRKICAVQSADAGFLTGTYPAALVALQTRERTLVCWHDTAAQWMDAALLANRLVYDPDVVSASWDAPISGVDPYVAAITTAQRNFALANDVNLGRPYGGSTFFVDPGVNGTGRPMYEIETSDWFYARLQEDVAAEKVNHSARGAKLTVDPVGQAKIKSLLDGRGSQGLGGRSPHFIAFDSQAVDITDADRTAQRLRFTAQAQIAVSGRIFEFDLNFSREALE
jgi:hypothetical protein